MGQGQEVARVCGQRRAHHQVEPDAIVKAIGEAQLAADDRSMEGARPAARDALVDVLDGVDRARDVPAAERVQAQLQEITAKGAQANLIYVDVPEYQDAYSIKGRYQLNGEAVSLQAKLFKGNTPLGDIQAEGTAGELSALVEEILQQAFSILQSR